jgi:hypothetical protein
MSTLAVDMSVRECDAQIHAHGKRGHGARHRGYRSVFGATAGRGFVE